MRTHETYYDNVAAIDGKKYKEATSFGFPFLSRHKEKCRNLIRTTTGTYEDQDGKEEPWTHKIYMLSTRDEKREDAVYNICRICGYSIKSFNWHAPEDEV